jgi:hypothetical protein
MKGSPAIYLDRIVDKKHFRAFVHGTNGEKKLVNSWDEFEAAMESGIWFATVEDAQEIKTIATESRSEPSMPKPKPKPGSRPRRMSQVKVVEEVEDSENTLPDDESVFEVKDGE